MSAKKKELRNRSMMYTQQLQHLPFTSVDELVECIETVVCPKEYGVIVHNMDLNKDGTPAEEHVHVMMRFENARSPKAVAKQLKDKPERLHVWKTGSYNNGFAYLIHATANAKSKHQYDASDVKANFDFEERMERMKAEIAKATKKGVDNVDELLDDMYNGYITKEFLEERLTGSQYGRYKKRIEDVWQKRLQNKAEEWRKEKAEQGANINTIWIFGRAGVGKTSLAREYANKAGQEYFISGSSRDIFQGYAGQHTMILDEFRPNIMPYSDLLRITDPFGVDSQVMAPSRYSDKALACDLIIITSPFDPYRFYQRTMETDTTDTPDSFDQLLRRLSLVISMDEQTICATEYQRVTIGGEFVPIQGTERPNPYSYIHRPAPSVNAVELYNSIFD